MWTGREPYGFVACSKIDVEPCDERVDEVISAAVECKWYGKDQVCGRTRVEIESEDSGGVSHNSFDLNSVNKGLCECRFLEGSVVEAVDIVPNCAVLVTIFVLGGLCHTPYFFILIFAILNSSHENGRLVREYQAIGGQIFVSRIQDSI